VGYCIIIPAFNASLSLPAVVAEALQSGVPVLVVDDGSTDATSESVRGLPVNLVIHDRNRGKGAALKSGFSWMLLHGFEGAVTLDADGQHDAGAIILLADTARRDGTDILIASRAVQFAQMAGLRKSWNRFGAWCMKKRTGFDITDSQSGFRYYSSQLLRGVTLDADGYHLEMEILMKGWRGGFRVGSLPVAARVADGRATSHFRPVTDTWNICMTFLRFF